MGGSVLETGTHYDVSITCFPFGKSHPHELSLCLEDSEYFLMLSLIVILRRWCILVWTFWIIILNIIWRTSTIVSFLFTLTVWRLAKVRTDFGNLIKTWFFRTFLLKAHYYPSYYIGADWSDWKVPSKSGILYIKTVYVVDIYILCWAREARTLIVLNIKWVQFVL